MRRKSDKHYLFGIEVDGETKEKYRERRYVVDGREYSYTSAYIASHSRGIVGDIEYLDAWRIIEQIRKELSEPARIGSLDRVCPMSFASAEPRKCREDCALFVTPEGWEEGCCSIACMASCSNFIAGDLEEIDMRFHNATP
jgi:hypothetical protein